MAAMDRETLLQLWSKARYWIAFIGIRRLVSAVVSGVVAIVVMWLILRPSEPPLEASIPLATFPVATTTSTPSIVTVHVAGAVKSPGVYRLAVSARVIDAVTAAGGPASDADLERINLAQVLVDTEQVFIPGRTTRSATPTIAPRHRPTTTVASPRVPTQQGTSPSSGALVDLNTAMAPELDALPGVGPATAKAIIDYRTSKGKFSRVEDLLNVAGIGPAKLAALRDLVTVAQ
jgi:competence protein ComEA